MYEYSTPYKKSAFVIILPVLIIGFVVTIFLLTTQAKALELPNASSVLSIEMEQITDHESLGQVMISDRDEINTALSVLSQTRKTLNFSVNDYPTQSNYLAIRLKHPEEQTILYLYKEGNTYYIEMPYADIYRTNEDTNVALYNIYSVALNNHATKTAKDTLLVDSPNGAYTAKAYGANTNVTAAGEYPYDGLCIIRNSDGATVWNEDGYYSAQFLWSDNSKYVAICVEARTWGESFIVDAENGNVIKLPDLNAISALLDTTSQPDTNRLDPYFKAVDWVNDSTICVDYRFIARDGDKEVSGTYEYDLINDNILLNNSTISGSSG
ncbi:DUF5301 domain-containing protein [Candidatus Galacturonibacter soehngenii]|uniref:DUF5301 domain-containing protein n=1 Tax=Candidatus Galacturonatibacter soehngenii TaxID=2307010 RepID=UPI0017840975|nr:DUF5301 domain-containing protein [Candidatus Galacturonibacter soehngenii]MBA4687894.1 DUF5301 domain-containing protein [Candidatus Galacturonibacter soehngenii]